MEVYVLLQLRDCPSPKAKRGSARAARVPLLVSHSNGGRKEGRWIGRLQRCMLAGARRHSWHGGEGGGGSSSRAIMPFGVHQGFDDPGPGSQQRTPRLGCSVQASSAHGLGPFLWFMISATRICALETWHWKGIKNEHRNATSHGISVCIRTKKAMPIPAKIPNSLLREGTSRRAHAFLSSPYVTTYPSLRASVSASLTPTAVQQRQHSSQQLWNL